MGIEFSRQFALRYVGAGARASATVAAHGIRATIADRLRKNRWLSPQARRATTEKIDQTDLKIGYPDEWPDVATFTLTESFLANVVAARGAQRKKSGEQMRAPRRRSSWEMVVSPNGAAGPAAARLMIPGGYPDAFSNSIIITAAYLFPPLFDASAPPEVHYGAFGSVFGHELVHVLEQHEFDRTGQPGELWTAADITKRDELVGVSWAKPMLRASTARRRSTRTLLISAALNCLRGDGRQLGSRVDERGSDGITAAQRFFYSYAHGWCGKQLPDAERDTIEHDGHAPRRFRVNGPLANSPEFAAAFRCAPTAKMVRPAAERCSLW